MIELQTVQAHAVNDSWLLEVMASKDGTGLSHDEILRLYQDDFDPDVIRIVLRAAVLTAVRGGHIEQACEVPQLFRLSRIGRRTLELRRATNRHKSEKFRGFTRLVGPWFKCCECGEKVRDIDHHENGGCTAR